MEKTNAHRQRLGLRVTGIIQGVGFRPTIHRLAQATGLGGYVRNEAGSVWIEIEGPPQDLERFVSAMPKTLEGAAAIDSIATMRLPPRGEETFSILESLPGESSGLSALPPDLAPCERCLGEIDDPRDRRHGHAFASCASCGPRFTVARELPWDRRRTTMAPFALCASCLAEYEGEGNRRFHAETTACPGCGPRLRFAPETRATEAGVVGDAALEAAIDALGQGQIIAVKGIGGYLLAVDATNERAVATLRERKQRPHKPFAVMVRGLGQAEQIAIIDPVARAAFTDPARPIVLVPMCNGSRLAPAVAPGLREIGLFLAPTPLQHLLVTRGPSLLVMTSGNRSEEPIAIRDEEAFVRLAGIADGFLFHDREIEHRADDSVVRPIGEKPAVLRRARGFVPRPIHLPEAGPPLLAVGAGDKVTVCLTSGTRAYLSTHLGKLAHPEGWRGFEAAVADLQRMTGVAPMAVVHDLHPDLPSTRWARKSGLRCIGVQHHHAHFASCLVEHGFVGPAIGVVFDGTGYGTDGTLWGGEFLVGDLGSCERRAHLAPLLLPGGEAAIRAPWRIALAALEAIGESAESFNVATRTERAAVEQIIRKGIASPQACGAGRWFDAVAALCGLCSTTTYEGQAAMSLEAHAEDGPSDPYPFEIRAGGHPWVVDWRPMFAAVAADLRRGTAVGRIAARFHETLAMIVAACCERLQGEGAPRRVALTGGCFQNRRLAERATELLASGGFEVLLQRNVPPNDGGLSLGQAAIAARRLSAEG